MSFPVLQKRDTGDPEFSIEASGIYFATQPARLTFRVGHVLGFVHYVRVSCVTVLRNVSINIFKISGFGGLEVACRPLVTKFAGSKPAEAFGFLGRKNHQHPFLRRFAAGKRSLNLRGSRNLGKITTGYLSRPQFHLSLLGSLESLKTQRHVAAKAGTSKGGGKQWQTTPKNFRRAQCAISVP